MHNIRAIIIIVYDTHAFRRSGAVAQGRAEGHENKKARISRLTSSCSRLCNNARVVPLTRPRVAIYRSCVRYTYNIYLCARVCKRDIAYASVGARMSEKNND